MAIEKVAQLAETIMPIKNIVMKEILPVVNLINAQVTLVQGNPQQCQRLAERVSLIAKLVGDLESSNKIPKHQQDYYIEALAALKATLEESLALIKDFSDSTWLKRIWDAGGYHSKLTRIYQLLADNTQQLNLGLSIKQVFDKEQDREDRQKDQEILLAKQDEIIQETQAAKSAVQRLDLEELKRHQVLAKEIASIKYALVHLCGADQIRKSKIAKTLYVPFFQLAIDELLASGSFGDIYVGKYLSQPVAIKLLERELTDRERKEFEREIMIMQDLRSDYIMPIYAVCDEPGRACIVMKYMEQGTLRRALDRNPTLSLKARHQLVLDVVMGLYYLHHQEIVHGDLNSDNVFVDTEGRARLANFTLSKAKGSNITSVSKHSIALQWLPPEVLLAETSVARITAQGDIYSLGVVLWEIMTGKKPYSNCSEKEFIDLIRRDEREFIPEHIPALYHDIIRTCWQKEPVQRSTLEAFLHQLQAYKVSEPLAIAHDEATIDPDVFFAAGCHYEKLKQFEQAAVCYQRAVNVGHLKAKTNLAMLYMQGFGVEISKVKANSLLTEAAEAGHERAMGNLAYQLEKGDGVPKDIPQACYWYGQLAQRGDSKAQQKQLQLQKLLEEIGSVTLSVSESTSGYNASSSSSAFFANTSSDNESSGSASSAIPQPGQKRS
jgi:serine/threonine protein kinase